MYIHEEREAFKDLIEQVADDLGKTTAVVEKDYYVTQILRLLAGQLNNCVFKGGITVLSKCKAHFSCRNILSYSQTGKSFTKRIFVKHITSPK